MRTVIRLHPSYLINVHTGHPLSSKTGSYNYNSEVTGEAFWRGENPNSSLGFCRHFCIVGYLTVGYKTFRITGQGTGLNQYDNLKRLLYMQGAQHFPNLNNINQQILLYLIENCYQKETEHHPTTAQIAMELWFRHTGTLTGARVRKGNLIQ